MSTRTISVTINEYGKLYRVNAVSGRQLKDLLRTEGISFSFPCSGRGRCGGCKVRFLKGVPTPSAADEALLTAKELSAGVRLLCRAIVREDCEVMLDCREEDMEALVSDEGRIKELDEKRALESRFAIAVDLGTTTIAAALVVQDEDDPTPVRFASSVNHQRKYGADVVSRIDAAGGDTIARDMNALVMEDIALLIKELLAPEEGIQIPVSNLDRITIAGNTTMLYLLEDRDVSWLGRYPYGPAPFGLGMEVTDAGELFEDYEGAQLTIMPGISGFVGADIVSGLYYLTQSGADTKDALFVDLGTNGEMAFFDDDRIRVTSTAAGPVFEAGGISCGVASIPGAICHVELFRDGGEVRCRYETIGDQPPIGLCGTGVMELVSEAVREGIIDETGLLTERYFDDGFPVTEDGTVRLFQRDIRNVQLAKAAIYTGIKALLGGRTSGAVYLAGGFGSRIDTGRIKSLKMFPEDFDGKIVAVGNTSLKGSVVFSLKALMGESMEDERRVLTDIPGRAQLVELSAADEFDSDFVDAMNF